MMSQVYFDIPGIEGIFSVGFMTGIIVTLPTIQEKRNSEYI
jgi:hypothetical protein